MPRAGFEPTIPVFGRSKTVHALDRAAIGTGKFEIMRINVEARDEMRLKFFEMHCN
jgi:hypothetical protein